MPSLTVARQPTLIQKRVDDRKKKSREKIMNKKREGNSLRLGMVIFRQERMCPPSSMAWSILLKL